MAVSGTVSTTTVMTSQIIETAYRRCGVSTGKLTWELLSFAKLQLFTSLSSLPNKGQLLWTIKQSPVGLVESQGKYLLPNGVVDVDKAFLRQVTQQSGGTAASSAGGTAANAFDGDINTVCTQTAPNGNISYDFGSDVTVTYVGVMSNGSNAWALTLQSSTDGVTWTTVYTPTSQTYVDRVFTWFMLDTPRAGQYFRVAVSGGGTLAVRELSFSYNPFDQEISRLNQDDYSALPNKTFAGDPNQFWLERPYNATYANVWPVPNDVFKSLVFWNRRYVMDVGQVYEQLEVPQRWLDAIMWDLAWRVSHEITEEVKPISPQLIEYLGNMAVRYVGEAFDEERDKSPVRFSPSIGCYTA